MVFAMAFGDTLPVVSRILYSGPYHFLCSMDLVSDV